MLARSLSAFVIGGAATMLLSLGLLTVPRYLSLPYVSVDAVIGIAFNVALGAVSTAFTMRAARNMSSAVYKDLARKSNADNRAF